jgi:hypothetical protein
MNIIKQSAIACVLVLTPLLLPPIAMASNNDYSNAEVTQYSEAELAQILAPIALYPDSLLTHIVIASTYPLDVVEAYRWRERNSNLNASEAAERAADKGWDPSVVALVAFPSVLERLNEDLTWTQDLGDAFLADEERVLDTIQVLRRQAMQANTLTNMQNMRVTQVNRQIIIEPVQREIVYVPYYDTRVVYGNWRWNRYPPTYWDSGLHVSVGFGGRHSGRFHWSPGINIGFNYHFSAFNWSSRHLLVTHHHQTRAYRSHARIASSHGAKRWQHKPSHRRNIAYRSNEPKWRNNSLGNARQNARHNSPRNSPHNDRQHARYKSHSNASKYSQVRAKQDKRSGNYGMGSKKVTRLRDGLRSRGVPNSTVRSPAPKHNREFGKNPQWAGNESHRQVHRQAIAKTKDQVRGHRQKQQAPKAQAPRPTKKAQVAKRKRDKKD